VRGERGVLGDSHADHVDDLALVSGNALVEEGEVGAARGRARDVPFLHRVARDARDRLALEARIDDRHGVAPFSYR